MNNTIDELLNNAKFEENIIMDILGSTKKQQAYNIMLDLGLISQKNNSVFLSKKGYDAIKQGGVESWKRKINQVKNLRNTASTFSIVASVFVFIIVIFKFVL